MTDLHEPCLCGEVPRKTTPKRGKVGRRHPTDEPRIFLVEVKLDRDAIGALCLDCGLFMSEVDPVPWRWQDARAAHRRATMWKGPAHKMVPVAIEVDSGVSAEPSPNAPA